MLISIRKNIYCENQKNNDSNWKDDEVERVKKAINGKKKGVPAYRLTNFSRNSRTFPHSIINKEGGEHKSSKFVENKKGVAIACPGKWYWAKDLKLMYKIINP